ncbi:Hsp20/alpha crystallin family protein [Cooperia oncophora]
MPITPCFMWEIKPKRSSMMTRNSLVALDVSHFRPEELKVQLEGRDLTIEGHQELKSEHGYIKKNFVHEFRLPEDCDLDAVQTLIDNDGHLTVEAPKTGMHTNKRILPIMPTHKRKGSKQ